MKGRRCRLRVRGACALLVLALLAALPLAQALATGDASAASQSRGALIDTFMAGAERNQGVAVATSIGAQDVVERYYGAADPATGEAVGASTAFDWGRCSDAVVWACVMQLVEAGSLELGDTVADLLPPSVQLPQGYAGLDVIDLMNHAAGLDVAMTGSAASLLAETTSVLPAFSLFSTEGEFRPGSIVAYTPYDALLAAAIVEQVSGVPFAEYVQVNVLERLGMDQTRLFVGGTPAQAAAAGGLLAALAAGTDGPPSVSSPRSSTSTVLTCTGPVTDLLKLANGLMCVGEGPALFDDPSTAEQLFGVSRTYPSLGVARIAHGLFAFPFTAGVFGISGTSSAGFSASVYMDRTSGLAVAVLVNQSGRADLTQGITRVLVGRSDAVVANASSPANGMWTGTYQDAGRPNHGPSKVLTALERVHVTVNDQGVLVFDGLTATSLGAGVYSVDTAIDQDVYRFHVGLERGAEFSRVTADSYEVPYATLVIEYGLLGAEAAAFGGCAAYVLAAFGSLLRARVRRRRVAVQPAVLFLAVASLCAAGAAVFAALQIAEGLPPAALDALLVFEGAYVVAAAAVAVWIGVTRWRGSSWTRAQNAACASVALCALVTVMNLVYWDMLP